MTLLETSAQTAHLPIVKHSRGRIRSCPAGSVTSMFSSHTHRAHSTADTFIIVEIAYVLLPPLSVPPPPP